MNTTKYVVCRTHKPSGEVSFLSYSFASEKHEFVADVNKAKSYSLEASYNLMLTYPYGEYTYSIGISQTTVDFISPSHALVHILEAKLEEEVKSSQAKVADLSQRIKRVMLDLEPSVQEAPKEYAISGNTYVLVPETTHCEGCAFLNTGA